MAPPSPKGVKRLSARLWAYVQNSSRIDISLESNAHYSAWPRLTLSQPFSTGGLNAQDFETFLIALHSKWIFKLLDPRHLASWKSLPFYFITNFVPGLGDSVFMVDPSLIPVLKSSTFPTRWFSFLQSWLSSGLVVSPPPLDFECILNEPIWFNRFLYLPSDEKRGRLRSKTLETSLSERGFCHIKDLLCSISCAGRLLNSPWLSRTEALTLTGSSKMTDALMSLIELILHSWTDVVRRKLHEPFLCDEWFVDKELCKEIPFYVFKIVEVFPGKLRCTSYLCHFADGRLPNSPTHQNSVILQKSQVTKACVLSFEINLINATNACHQ
jgi:hypothetical protein